MEGITLLHNACKGKMCHLQECTEQTCGATLKTFGPTMRPQTVTIVQLADGYIEKPIGLLEKVVVSSCGVEYEHMFAIVDFGKNPNYDVILGRPFMRQLKMIQDWGYNYIYLRQPQAVTRVNLSNHSYRDVARTPVEDFESATATTKSSGLSWEQSGSHLWMCGASNEEKEENKEENKE